MSIQMDMHTPGMGPGLIEDGVHTASGLRCHVHSGIFEDKSDCVARQQIANQTSWTALTLTRTRLPFPCTPCITYLQLNATPDNDQTFSVKVTGIDQFGQVVQEIVENQTTTPSRTIGTPSAPYKRKTRLWLSKVFAYITDVQYKAASVQGTDDRLLVGAFWDMDYSGNELPYENYIGRENQGVGTPFRGNGYGPNDPAYYPELLCVELVALDPQVFLLNGGSTVANPSVYSLLPSNDEMAITNFSVANPTVVTVNPNHGVVGSANQGTRFPVRIKGDDEQTFLNGDWIATWTAAGTFTIPVNVTGVHVSYVGISCYFPGMTGRYDRTTPFQIRNVQAPTPATLNALHRGILLNPWQFSVPLNVTVAGTEGHVEIPERPICVVDAYGGGESNRGGFRIGTHASGFRGSPHKWNIYKANAFGSVTPAKLLVCDEQTGDGGATPDLDGAGSSDIQIFPWTKESRIGFHAYYRTSVGTGRSSRSTSSYAR